MFHWNIDPAFLRNTRAVVSNRRVTTGIVRGTFTGARAKMLALIHGHKVSVDSGRESTRNYYSEPNVDDCQQMRTVLDLLCRVVAKFQDFGRRSPSYQQYWAANVCSYLQHTSEQQDQPDQTEGQNGTHNAIVALEVDPISIIVVNIRSESRTMLIDEILQQAGVNHNADSEILQFLNMKCSKIERQLQLASCNSR